MAGTRAATSNSVRKDHKPVMISAGVNTIVGGMFAILLFCACAYSQTWSRQLNADPGHTIEVLNLSGRVHVAVRANTRNGSAEISDAASQGISISAHSTSLISDGEIKVTSSGSRTRLQVAPSSVSKRIDIVMGVPQRVRLVIETKDGDVRIEGNVDRASVVTDTGTIAADVPTYEVKYDLLWTTSRPRYISDFKLEDVKERSGGKFSLKGEYKNEETDEDRSDTTQETAPREGEKPKSKKRNRDVDSRTVSLVFTTARGIILLNVPPNEVSSDLRERPLTNAAKAIVRSGDKVLTDAIRRASPKYFGDYAKTLPPMQREPVLTSVAESREVYGSGLKRAAVRVTDQFNRAISGLKTVDLSVTENGAEREVVSLEPITAPFNLVLLLDVSGSVDNYVNFIRKAARSFVDTVDRRDRVSIVLFNDDVKVLSKFTTDKGLLSESLDTFDAGGGTAYYDALAYTLADTLRPLKGERTAIVVLTDGDDNRSFLSFDGVLGAIQESGALIYPLYVPSGLVAASASANQAAQVDPLRMRYIGLTSKAEGEGEKLAAVSGGIYYPITQLSQIQGAYNDIVVQLRTAYSITYRSQLSETNSRRVSPRTKVRVKRPNAYAALGPITRVAER